MRNAIIHFHKSMCICLLNFLFKKLHSVTLNAACFAISKGQEPANELLFSALLLAVFYCSCPQERTNIKLDQQ